MSRDLSRYCDGSVHPGGAGTTNPRRELVIGQRGLIPWFVKTAKLPYATVCTPPGARRRQ